MHRIWSVLVAGAVALGAIASAVGAQSTCRVADEYTAATISYLNDMMNTQDTSWVSARQAYQLPVVADSAIVLVADSTLCAQAADAYNTALPAAARVAGRHVYIIRVGADRYVVWDRWTSDSLGDEYEVVMVFTGAFVLLEKFAT